MRTATQILLCPNSAIRSPELVLGCHSGLRKFPRVKRSKRVQDGFSGSSECGRPLWHRPTESSSGRASSTKVWDGSGCRGRFGTRAAPYARRFRGVRAYGAARGTPLSRTGLGGKRSGGGRCLQELIAQTTHGAGVGLPWDSRAQQAWHGILSACNTDSAGSGYPQSSSVSLLIDC